MSDGLDKNKHMEQRADRPSVTESEADRLSITRIIVGLLLMLSGTLLMLLGIVIVSNAIASFSSMYAPT